MGCGNGGNRVCGVTDSQKDCLAFHRLSGFHQNLIDNSVRRYIDGCHLFERKDDALRHHLVVDGAESAPIDSHSHHGEHRSEHNFQLGRGNACHFLRLVVLVECRQCFLVE